MRKAHLTVVETVYHTPTEGNPVASEVRYGLELDSDEQPYFREAKASAGWAELDTGWLEKSAGCVVVEAKEEPVELGVLHAGAYLVVSRLEPRTALRLAPARLLYIRGGRYTVRAFPC
jgi:hypothetical protein